jgi:hypothetical protein
MNVGFLNMSPVCDLSACVSTRVRYKSADWSNGPDISQEKGNYELCSKYGDFSTLLVSSLFLIRIYSQCWYQITMRRLQNSYRQYRTKYIQNTARNSCLQIFYLSDLLRSLFFLRYITTLFIIRLAKTVRKPERTEVPNRKTKLKKPGEDSLGYNNLK